MSSKHLTLVSGPFRTMFQNDSFREGQQLKAEGRATIRLPEDNADAMVILLNVIHHRYENVPREPLSISLLYQLGLLIDKYGMGKVISLLAESWTTELGSYFTANDSKTRAQLLCVDYTFDLPVLFHEATKTVMFHAQEEIMANCVPKGLLGTFQPQYSS